jgi:hypothetical protein
VTADSPQRLPIIPHLPVTEENLGRLVEILGLDNLEPQAREYLRKLGIVGLRRARQGRSGPATMPCHRNQLDHVVIARQLHQLPAERTPRVAHRTEHAAFGHR